MIQEKWNNLNVESLIRFNHRLFVCSRLERGGRYNPIRMGWIELNGRERLWTFYASEIYMKPAKFPGIIWASRHFWHFEVMNGRVGPDAGIPPKNYGFSGILNWFSCEFPGTLNKISRQQFFLLFSWKLLRTAEEFSLTLFLKIF